MYRRAVVTNERGLTRIPAYFLGYQDKLEYVDLSRGRLGAVTSIGGGSATVVRWRTRTSVASPTS